MLIFYPRGYCPSFHDKGSCSHDGAPSRFQCECAIRVKILFHPKTKIPTANIDPNVPTIVPIDVIEVNELETVSFRVSVNDKNGRSLANDPNLIVTTKGLPEGATTWNSGRSFRWTPDIQQSGIYEITFIAKNASGTDRYTVTIAVYENARPFFQLDTLYTRPVMVPNREMVRYYFIPLLENVGGIEVDDISYTILMDGRNPPVIVGNATIREDQIHPGNNDYYPFEPAFAIDVPYTQRREAQEIHLLVTGNTPDGERYEQHLYLTIGLGKVENDFTRFNVSSLFLKDLNTGQYLLEHAGTPSIPLVLDTLHVTGEVKASGHLDDDGYMDMIFEDEQTGRISFITWMQQGLWQVPQATIMDDIGISKSIIAMADFNGDFVEEIVAIDETTNEIQTWPFDVDAIHRGWVDSWQIPEHFELLKVADFNGDNRADYLWHDTYHNCLVIWKNGWGADFEEVLSIYDPSYQKILSYSSYSGNSGADVIMHDTRTNTITVYYFNEGAWNQSSLFELAADEWTYLGDTQLFGFGTNLIFRNREHPKNFAICLVSDKGWDIDLFTLPFDESWQINGHFDYDGDGMSEMVWSRNIEDAMGNPIRTEIKIWEVFQEAYELISYDYDTPVELLFP